MTNQTEALCLCGCGGLAPIALRNEPLKGYKKGQPKRFIKGHGLNMSKGKTMGKFEAETFRKEAESEITSTPNPPQIMQRETYKEVVFSPKGNPNDPNDVTLAVNGECLVIRRSFKVIVPDRFLEAADHALYAMYQQLPDKPRKITAWVKTFPYSVIRDKVSEEEYLAQRREGDRQTAEALKLDEVPVG
jgi:hypothetical protein